MSSDRIRGSFPGGPRRGAFAEPLDRAPRLERVAQIEERVARRERGRARKSRHGRVVAGFVVAMVVAGAVGAGIGLASHATREEITAEQEAVRAQDQFISKEVNRSLLELWKMEDVEALRNTGRTR
jgi:hypothetical protein